MPAELTIVKRLTTLCGIYVVQTLNTLYPCQLVTAAVKPGKHGQTVFLSIDKYTAQSGDMWEES